MDETIGQNSRALRLKLLPSFHQHVEVRLTPVNAGTAVWVWVQGEYMEPHPLPDRGPDFTEEALAPIAAFKEAVAAFEVSVAATAEEWRRIVLDGMSIEGTLVADGHVVELNEHAWRPGMDAVIQAVLRIGWDACQDPRVKNALGAYAKVNDVTYPILPVPPKPFRTHVMLLGDPIGKEALKLALFSEPSAA
jgi:hypothetical protein